MSLSKSFPPSSPFSLAFRGGEKYWYTKMEICFLSTLKSLNDRLNYATSSKLAVLQDHLIPLNFIRKH